MNLLALIFGNQTEMPALKVGQSSPSVPFADLLRAIGAERSAAPLIEATALQPNAPAPLESGEVAVPATPGEDTPASAGAATGEAPGSAGGEATAEPAADPLAGLDGPETAERVDGAEAVDIAERVDGAEAADIAERAERASRTRARVREEDVERQVRVAAERAEENPRRAIGGDRDREDEVREDVPRVIDTDDGEARRGIVHDRSTETRPTEVTADIDPADAVAPSGEDGSTERATDVATTSEMPGETRETPGEIHETPEVTHETPGETHETPGETHEMPEVTHEAADTAPLDALAPRDAEAVVPVGTGRTATPADITSGAGAVTSEAEPLRATAQRTIPTETEPLQATGSRTTEPAAIATKTDATAPPVEPETPFAIVRGEENPGVADRAQRERFSTRTDARQSDAQQSDAMRTDATRTTVPDSATRVTVAAPDNEQTAATGPDPGRHAERFTHSSLHGATGEALEKRVARILDGIPGNAVSNRAAGAGLRTTDEALHYYSPRFGTSAGATLEAPVVPVREAAAGASGMTVIEPAQAATAAGTTAAATGTGTGMSGDAEGNQAAGHSSTGDQATGRTAATNDADLAADRPRRESAFETIAARNAADPYVSSDSAHDARVSGHASAAGDVVADDTRPADSVLEALAPAGTLAARAAGAAESALRTRIVRAPLTQAVDQIARMVVTDQRTVTIQLTPADLGRIQGNIAVRNGRVTVQLEVDTESVQGVLQASVDQLQESLAREGMDLQALAVTVSGQEGNGRAWQGPAREPRAVPVREKSRKNTEKAQDTGKNSERSLNLLI